MVRSTVLIYWSNSRLLGNSSEKFTCSILPCMQTCIYALYCTIWSSTGCVDFLFLLKTCRLLEWIHVWCRFRCFQSFLTCLRCRQPVDMRTQMWLYLLPILFLQRGLSFNKTVNNIFFKQKRYIQCTSYCTSNSNSSLCVRGIQ